MTKQTVGQRGIALMIVLSAVTILSVAAVEFAYNTNVAYHLALNELDRAKAEYLAKSAYRFMLLELKYDRVFRQVVQSQNLGAMLGQSAQLPLCQQFPLSTGLIRMVFTSASEEKAGGEKDTTPKDSTPKDSTRMTSISEEEGATEFLNFEGDFDANCVDEATKMNLNAFAGIRTTPTTEGGVSPYNQYRESLVHFLADPQYEKLFEASGVLPDDAAQAIADWVDSNDTIDGPHGGGSEMSLYEKERVSYRVKNGKFSTPLEVYQVIGVHDDWFAPLADHFTIYGDGRINLCSAEEDVVQSVVRRYVESTPGLPPLRLDDPETMARLMTAVHEACRSGASGDALVTAVANGLQAAITVGAPAAAEGTAGNPAGDATGSTQGLTQLITATSRFYTITATGQVAAATLRIKAVVDIRDTDPKKWPVLYWKVY